MKWPGIAREAWRSVASGASRGVLFSLVIALVVIAAQFADALTIRSIVERADAFRAAGADILVIDAQASIDPLRCAALADIAGVQAAGALRATTGNVALTAPGTTIPSFQVTPGMPLVLGVAPAGAGIVLSDEVAGSLGLTTGATLGLTSGTTVVAGMYDYPQDGRRTGLGFAMLIPTNDTAPFDTCMVRAWPGNDTVQAQLLATLIPGAGAEAQAAQVVQLNGSLGREFDAEAAFESRPTQWLPFAALVIACLVGYGAMRLRRLELASARHLGVAGSDLIAIRVLETAIVLAPVLLLSALGAAVLTAMGPATDVGATLFIAMLAPLAGCVGAILGVGLGAWEVDERDLYRAFKER